MKQIGCGGGDGDKFICEGPCMQQNWFHHTINYSDNSQAQMSVNFKKMDVCACKSQCKISIFQKTRIQVTSKLVSN